LRFSVFTYALGVNWVIVTIYVPALLVSSFLIFTQLLGPRSTGAKKGAPSGRPATGAAG